MFVYVYVILYVLIVWWFLVDLLNLFNRYFEIIFLILDRCIYINIFSGNWFECKCINERNLIYSVKGYDVIWKIMIYKMKNKWSFF